MSSTAIAVHSEYAISCTGVAPASCRWYGQTLIGLHRGTFTTVQVTRSAASRRLGPGGKT